MYLVEVVNERRQFIALEVRHRLFVHFALEYVVELIVELGRSLVEAVELLQGRGIWWGHEECSWCGAGSQVSESLVVGEVVEVPCASPNT